jgi:2-polyprenyl-3-methyl-5-hydroxy-6-metoxy-1,4-benzoquinol methylase
MTSPHPESLRRFVAELNSRGGTYHRMDLGGGLIIEGKYDIARYLPHYRIPDDLRGMSVLDIGTASGFFALECERRGAAVTATDIHDAPVYTALRNGLGLHGRYVRKSVMDFDSGFGEFDLVVCGSLLLHLRDIIGALQRIRSVCRGTAIFATGVMADPVSSANDRRALCEFAGQRAVDEGGEYWTYWLPNLRALKAMLLVAGFRRAEEVSRFTLCSAPGRGNFATPHGVVHAFV